MRKSLPLSVCGAAALLSGLMFTVPANAATAPAHLTGHWSVKQSVTKNSNFVQTGTTTAAWSFTPTCATGACAIKMTRAHSDGSTVSYPIKPTANGTYVGSDTYSGGCYSTKTGQLLDPKGFTYVETSTIKPTTVKNATATAFTGTLDITAKPTKSGAAKHCNAGFIDLALKSVKRTS